VRRASDVFASRRHRQHPRGAPTHSAGWRLCCAGAGKNTLLRHILSNQAGKRVAVLVNDMATVNIDERLVADSVVGASGQQLVALTNGCICCTIREDLVREVAALAAQPEVRVGWVWRAWA
jgi:hypothetical protein